MLAFYGKKGIPKAGLIQDVAIEAGHSVAGIPTWMGLTARWRVKCVSLAEAKDILAGCKRLKQETRRWERLQYQQRLASLHQSSSLSVAAPSFQPKAAITILGPAERPCDSWEAETQPLPLSPLDYTSSRRDTLPRRGPYPLTSEDEAASDAGPADPSSCRRARRG